MKNFIFLFFTIGLYTLHAQTETHKGAKTNAGNEKTNVSLPRPKLVVGLVIDQMRWDFLYRYYARYSDNGFKRLLKDGFSCDNTMIPYTPTVTAAGHTCIYTGSVPAIHGIVGNNWIDRQTKHSVYCCDDDSVETVGATNNSGKMSPNRMYANTVGDELRLATNFKGKVIGVALKDRGAILPAGHSANAAYWFDSKTGSWVTSSYYMSTLPQWAIEFNNAKIVDKYFSQGWKTLYPLDTYTQSTKEENNYENNPFGPSQTHFPYDLNGYTGKNPGIISYTPHGNSLTFSFATQAIENEHLGLGNQTDMLCISVSSTDYIGHAFGPNSIEIEDTYLRLDADLSTFFSYLDSKLGRGNYTVFLAADHGVAHIPGFLRENKLPGGALSESEMVSTLNEKISSKYGIDKAIIAIMNCQVYLDIDKISSSKTDVSTIKSLVIDFLNNQPQITASYDLSNIVSATLPAPIKERFINGYYPIHSGDIQFMLKPGFTDGGKKGTTHGNWNPYDSHIPLIFYGWGIKKGKTNRETYMTDIAPTLSSLLHIQMPNGCIGKVVGEAIQ